MLGIKFALCVSLAVFSNTVCPTHPALLTQGVLGSIWQISYVMKDCTKENQILREMAQRPCLKHNLALKHKATKSCVGTSDNRLQRLSLCIWGAIWGAG